MIQSKDAIRLGKAYTIRDVQAIAEFIPLDGDMSRTELPNALQSYICYPGTTTMVSSPLARPFFSGRLVEMEPEIITETGSTSSCIIEFNSESRGMAFYLSL